MRVAESSRFLFQSAIVLAFLVGGAVLARPKPQTHLQTQKEYESLIFSVRGPDLYRAHCAPCHGMEGKGGGPVAKDLKTKPADLTLLARKNGGKYPAERVGKIISGDDPAIASHGSREMPIWGPIFHQIEIDQDFGNVRLANLVRYLESIQAK